ncbi:MAG: class I SAM-dependent methyltransferase [Chitinophagaceae bacterium]|nr:class I SAM-dependent methyltransferase [Chitinophagaceae bacterium]
MGTTVHYSACPVCASVDIRNVMDVKDNSVSGEMFKVAECGQCALRFTQDVPSESAIGRYYKSEDYISHSNTSKGIINRIYQLVRKRTMASKRQLVERMTGRNKGKMLDLGSGIGSFVNEMRQHGWEARGLEPDPGARANAKEQYSIELEDTGAFKTLIPGSFDAVTMWHVLEHVHDLHGYIKQLRTIIREDGKLLIAVPNYTSADANVYGEFWAAYDVPRHLYHFSPKSIQVLMEKNDMKVDRYVPMWYDPFYISLLSSKYRNGRTNWLGAGWNAARSTMKAMGDRRRSSSIIYVCSKRN